MTIPPFVFSTQVFTDRERAFADQQLILRSLWACCTVVAMVGFLLPLPAVLVSALARVPFSDKMLHFGVYYLLTVIPALHESKANIRLVMTKLVALSIVLELVQLFSGVRSFECLDIVAGCLGVLSGYVAGSTAVLCSPDAGNRIPAARFAPTYSSLTSRTSMEAADVMRWSSTPAASSVAKRPSTYASRSASACLRASGRV